MKNFIYITFDMGEPVRARACDVARAPALGSWASHASRASGGGEAQARPAPALPGHLTVTEGASLLLAPSPVETAASRTQRPASPHPSSAQG